MKSGQGHIELAGIGKSYDEGASFAVQGINLKIPDGSYCCFLGPSGCGKSTILRMIAGHEDPTEGKILIGGENVVGLPPIERRTAMMFQSYALFPHLSVRDNIAFSLRVRGLSLKERNAKADQMIEKVHLSELANRLPGQLSGGQQQRVALARAAITEPRVLLLDEPLSALDEHLRIQMRAELRLMQKELGITFVHVTHTQMEAIALSDMVVVMDKGNIRQAGTAREIYSAPRDRYVAEFIGGQNVLSGRVGDIENGMARLGGDSFGQIDIPLADGHRLSLGDRLDVAIRRDDVDLRPVSAQADLPGSATSIVGRVQAIEYQGNYVKVQIDAAKDDEFVSFMPERKFYEAGLTVGDAVLAVWDIHHTQLLA